MNSTPTVTLTGLLPLAFDLERDLHTGSEIWLNPRREFLPGKRYLIKSGSGGGKSSLCAYLHGNRRDYRGTLTLFGKDAGDMQMDEWLTLRRDAIAYLPQEPGLFPSLTAMENILLKNRLTGRKTPDQIADMLDLVGMSQFAGHPAGKLSVGQQQRVALVRSLCQPFRLLLLDEPVSHLDEEANIAAARLVEREATSNGATVIVTSVGNDLRLGDCERLSL